jgi:hypothetical protein
MLLLLGTCLTSACCVLQHKRTTFDIMLGTVLFFKCFSLRILEGGLSCNCMLQIATQVPAITCLLIFWLAIQEKNRYNIWLFSPPIRDVVFGYCRLHFCVTIFNSLESLNLGYNKKGLWSLLVSVGELEWQTLTPKEKTLVTSYKFKLKLHISNKY